MHVVFQGMPTQAQSLKPYIGIHGGVNFTQPQIMETYTIVTLISGEELQGKQYDPIFRNFGHQIGITFALEINDHFSVGLMPQIAAYSYGYSSLIDFFTNDGSQASTAENISEYELNYINFPVYIQYIIREAAFSPYLTAGFSYGYLRNVQHQVVTNTTIYAEEENLVFSQLNSNNYSTGFIHSKMNLFGGIGVFYEFTLFRLAVDFTYWYGLNNIVNETRRFENQTISGSTYDISDDIKLHHLVMNFSILFPINKPTNRGSLDCVLPQKRR